MPAVDRRDREALVAAQAAIITLRSEIGLLRAVNAEQGRVIAEQAGVIASLTDRVAEMEGRLAKDSSNSSKPPSSDGLGKKPRPARPRQPGARSQGKQSGAPGAHLSQVGDPDEVVRHSPARCRGCGADLAGAPVTGVETRQVFDLPALRLLVTEHRAERRVCACGQATSAGFPAQARSAACYGPGVRSLIGYLGVYQHLSVARAARLLDDVFGAPVATGTIATVIAEGAAGLGGFTDAVRAQLRAAPVAHFDETGARVAGKLHWVHSASTSLLTWLSVHPKRGTDAMDDAGVLGGFGGVAVHDCWAPYWQYPALTHALCGAHLLRELDAVAETPGQGWAGELAEWFTIAHQQAEQARTAGAGRVPAALAADLHARYAQIITTGHAANPPVDRPPGRRGRTKRSAAANLLDRLDRHRQQVCRFLDDLRVPLTNNQAERDIRMVKLQQKISGCWRTLPGARAFLTLRSYISTARKHGHNPLDVLRQLFNGQPWLPPATTAMLPALPP